MSKLLDRSEGILRVLVRYFGLGETKSAFSSTKKNKGTPRRGGRGGEGGTSHLSLFIIGLTPYLSDRWITEHQLVAIDEQGEYESEGASVQ